MKILTNETHRNLLQQIEDAKQLALKEGKKAQELSSKLIELNRDDATQRGAYERLKAKLIEAEMSHSELQKKLQMYQSAPVAPYQPTVPETPAPKKLKKAVTKNE